MNRHEVQEQYGKVVDAIKMGENVQALRLVDSLLLKVPDFVIGWSQRGALLEKMGNSFDAMVNYDRAIGLSPESANLYNNRGVSFLSMQEYDRAIEDFNHALHLQPLVVETWRNVGNTYRRILDLDKAEQAYRRAIMIQPNDADSHLGLSMCLLEKQQFEEGWSEFEWRFKSGQMPPRGLKQAIWEGHPAVAKDSGLYVYGEQGFGDVLQFVRYAKLAKERWGGKIYIETRFPLFRLLKECVEGIDDVIIMGENVPFNVTHQIAMMSMPRIIGTEKGFHGPYFKPRDELKTYWANRIKKHAEGLKVGICWAGMNRESNNTASAIDARRSLTLDAFTQMAKIKGITWVSLQKGPPSQQVKFPPAGMRIIDYTSDLDDFYDTAGLISQLDLVISVDTSVMHLAAGLGCPTWMLSRYDGCWRWFGNRPDSPWYPTMTQYRQPSEGDWQSALDQMTRDLQRFVANKRQAA